MVCDRCVNKPICTCQPYAEIYKDFTKECLTNGFKNFFVLGREEEEGVEDED